MGTTFASIGFAVESSRAVKAADDLDKPVSAVVGAEKAVDNLGKAGEGLANAGKKISQAEAEAAQCIDKATSAKERQVDAIRKAGSTQAGYFHFHPQAIDVMPDLTRLLGNRAARYLFGADSGFGWLPSSVSWRG